LWAWDEWQVETVAQFGVVFLLFALGLEFSMSKLRVVRAVAVIGGFLQIALFMCLCSLTAVLCGAKASEGIFVGAFLSMSSTAVVSPILTVLVVWPCDLSFGQLAAHGSKFLIP
jgi:Kef-type K+ transport system membrane component KefB